MTGSPICWRGSRWKKLGGGLLTANQTNCKAQHQFATFNNAYSNRVGFEFRCLSVGDRQIKPLCVTGVHAVTLLSGARAQRGYTAQSNGLSYDQEIPVQPVD